KAGDIGDGEQSHLDIIVEHEQSNLVLFAYWRSSEVPGDTLAVSVDRGNDGIVDEFIGQWSGVPAVQFDPNYPASLPETVAVGASSSWDCRSAYSQFGPGLDFLAPSAGGPLTTRITTTDVTGGLGYDHTNYNPSFGGTSAASPLAAGIAGLILSVAPDLTAEEVRQLMRDTADKIGPEPYVEGRNDRYGYGRVNAHRALAALTGEQETADLVLAKTAEEDQVRLREELEYSITVTNGGPAQATNITVTDTLPQEVILEEASEDCAFEKGTLVCSLASLPAGEAEEFQFEVTVLRVPEDRLLINQATVTADQTDAHLGNNTAEVVTPVIGSQSRREREDERGQNDDRDRSTSTPD
nr:S8 family serine peptidase [Gammaproteobacteria bacterium]